MSDKGKEKEVPVKEIEKDFDTMCSDLEKQLKANKMDAKVTKELKKCLEQVKKKTVQEANKQASKEKKVKPLDLKPYLKKPPKDLFLPIRLEGVPSVPGKADTIKIKLGSKNLFLEGKIKIDDKKGQIYFDKGAMLIWKGTF